MKKDKRGLALITAIAVLALMLILFGGLATIYSAQVSRGKVELEQSQAMLIAQSYAEMLDQVLTSNNESADDLKEALGSIKAGKEVEIESRLANQPDNVIDSQVKITATADTATVSGNTTTRKINVKVSATVDDETRSIDLDYTYMYSRNALNLQNYSVYGNQINIYRSYEDVKNDQNGERINFEEVWYDDEDEPKEADLERYDGDLYRLGLNENEKPVFVIEKDEDVLPDDYTEENKSEILNDFALAKNGDAEPTVLQPWKNLDKPSDTIPNCSELNDNKSNKIDTSCIWDLENNNNNGTVQVKAKSEDIIIYMPINEVLKLDYKIKFQGNKTNNLFIYAYGSGVLTIDSSTKIETENDDDVTDIYFISNDVIDINIDGSSSNAKELEAYFYFPKGTVILDGAEEDRIKGALIADRIALLGSGPFEMEYVKPKKDVLENAGIGDSESGAGSAIISFTLNSYNEGGKS